jgi:hypothetical protein
LPVQLIVVCGAQSHVGSGVPPQGDFRTVYSKNPGIASGGAQRAGYLRTGQKPKFHKALRDIGRKIDVLQDAVFALLEFR